MNGNKDINYKFRVDEDENFLIEKKFKNSGLSSKSEFFRQMILSGYVITADEEFHKMINELLRNISNNINQIALVANRSGGIYKDDLNEIKKQLTEIWKEQNYIRSRIKSIEKVIEDESKELR